MTTKKREKQGKQVCVTERRSMYVAKSNEVLRQARMDLTLQELKLLNYLISLVKPDDTPDTVYHLTIKEYCEVRGISDRGGVERDSIKASLKNLRNKSWWMVTENGDETLASWIDKPTITRGGKITLKFDSDICRYIIGLKKEGYYAQYELLNTLPMQSSYSIRIYEYLKSYIYNQNEVEVDIDHLKKICNVYEVKSYQRYAEFRRRVLDRSVQEINMYTDIDCTFKQKCKGRKVSSLVFYIKQKDMASRLTSYSNAERKIDKTKGDYNNDRAAD